MTRLHNISGGRRNDAMFVFGIHVLEEKKLLLKQGDMVDGSAQLVYLEKKFTQ